MKRINLILIAIFVLLLSPLTTFAADYPHRPVKYIVPWPPGDLEDVLTRIIAEEMSKETGKPATVVNKPGGAGIVGAAEVSRARADGLTIGSFVADILTTHILSGNAPFDQSTFEPVGIFLDYPFVIAVKADAPYNNMQELAEYSKNNNLSLAHFGYQALPTAITFKAADEIGLKFSSNAPFDSIDCSTLANGDADVVNTVTQTILSCLKSGDVKIIASITHERLSISPDVATLEEQTGVPQTTWNGLFVKKGTPEKVKNVIAEIAQKALATERVENLSQNTGASVFWIGGQEAQDVIANDFASAKELLDYMK
ncbi:tripartite tricarboxylate transporter substrate binding protein [Vibrio sp. Isolate31]|uniref:tripartite tricarboxylate transporter substrate binding protein n=1 Tax=unclassified Vibrio TaxID=2614977 RepID=UPI001EFDC786|nr:MULTISPECIES: tripartite tricarboxylate transporter substrate binding protein [unclassified Vibrio]MCG9554781.1 tripartite tricarboxylate transporter substrate binding protein [Vibrio sp. Isolate32]MCG9603407.1 tripartite tricarboxylate transporter substrate binding protein [Vibrio sp. Isolate31]